MNPLLLIALLVMLAVFATFAGVYRWLRWISSQNEIIESLRMTDMGLTQQSRRGRVNEQLGRFAIAGRIEQQLLLADTQLTVAEYLMLQIGVTMLGFLVGWGISGHVIGGLLLAGIGWILPGVELRRRQGQRERAFADQLPDMLSLLAGSLRAGYGLLHACRVIKEEMPDPISTEFARVIKETSLGFSLGEALDHLVHRINNDDLELVVTAIHVQNEVGGSLADILETITETIRERVYLKGEIRVMTSQQRMTGWILSLLPFGVGTILMMINPTYMMEMFKPGWTLMIPIVTVIMIIMGNIVMRWVMKIEV